MTSSFLRVELLNVRTPFLAAILLVCSLWGMMAGSALAEDPENNLGSWVNANSTVRFSDRWSFFAQVEVRHWEFASNLNEILLRGAGHYKFYSSLRSLSRLRFS